MKDYVILCWINDNSEYYYITANSPQEAVDTLTKEITKEHLTADITTVAEVVGGWEQKNI
jgi:hypothetical protein